VRQLAGKCQKAWPDREALTEALLADFDSIPYCTYLYVVDTRGIQFSDNVSRDGRLPEHFGRDRSPRPYMKEAGPDQDFVLSEAYISLSARRPSITALQTLYRDGEPVGYLGVDLDLRDLPTSGDLYVEPSEWHQIKGDPAIRGTVFQQTRVESALDSNIDQAVSILEELIVERGVFRRPYPADAEIPADHIGEILQGLKALRFADDTLYLRAASINIFNGLISLTFSCDGSHYMPYSEFLEKDTAFWFGSAESS
jgi:hypothetical protein